MQGVARGVKLQGVRRGLLAIQRRLIDDERFRALFALGVSPRHPPRGRRRRRQTRPAVDLPSAGSQARRR